MEGPLLTPLALRPFRALLACPAATAVAPLLLLPPPIGGRRLVEADLSDTVGFLLNDDMLVWKGGGMERVARDWRHRQQRPSERSWTVFDRGRIQMIMNMVSEAHLRRWPS